MESMVIWKKLVSVPSFFLIPGEKEPPPATGDQARNDEHDEVGEERKGRGESGRDGASEGLRAEGNMESAAATRESSDREEIQPTGQPFAVRRVALCKDRVKRKSSGRRTTTRTDSRGGRYVKSQSRPSDRDVAVDATLRACAPFQKERGRTERLIIEQEDLRFKQRERKTGHLALFVGRIRFHGSKAADDRSEGRGAVSALGLLPQAG